MGFLGNLKNYAKDAATAKVDEAKSAAKAKAREAMESTSVGSAALGFVDKVNASQQPEGCIFIDGDSKQKAYIYAPSRMPRLSQGDRITLEVRPTGDPMVSESSGGEWSPFSNPDTYPLFYEGVQVGMTGSMRGFYEHAFRVGLKVLVACTCHGMYDEVTPDLFIDGWSYAEWVAFFEGRQ